MKDFISIAVIGSDSSVVFYEIPATLENILIINTDERALLSEESHINKKDLRAYIDSDGIRKIGAFDNPQPSPSHAWSEESADWIITAEKQAELEAQEKQFEIDKLENELNQLKQDLIFAQAMGDDISDIAARVKEVREELGKFK